MRLRTNEDLSWPSLIRNVIGNEISSVWSFVHVHSTSLEHQKILLNRDIIGQRGQRIIYSP